MRFIATSILILFTGIVFSQITMGKVSYDVQLSSDDERMAAYIGQMEGSLLEIFFMDDKLRSDFFMGEMSTTSLIGNKTADNSLLLMDNMYMGKIAVQLPKDAEESDDDMSKSMTVRSVDFVDGETKEVLGYTCKKALVTYENDFVSEVWYTEQIVPNYRKGQYVFEEIPGLPLELTGKTFGMDMKMTAFEIRKKLSKKHQAGFSLDTPKGYTERTMEELRSFGRSGR